ncbi:YicC/YloC family endoribonuclease [Acanthopleuribacter pedis]|uniref:YicC family protein n=1 Tax=Acanthopleuribacter pedis TaxID=442870 RepID=A0A8J7QAD5_9BACT|nr:YicC/YloC family endoribonuclease [Acanthopleuribacter pedis]MBO1317126.1 YicC family protein [Acanthopleuribacter pedis]
MLYSMTGYGEAVVENDDLRAGFRIKSVNNKGLDINLKLPFDFMYLEGELRRMLKKSLFRGRIDVFCEIEIRDPDALPPTPLNRSRMKQLVQLAEQIKGNYPVEGALELNTLIRMSDLTVTQRTGFRLPEAFEQAIRQTVTEAVGRLEASRRKEGANLEPFFLESLAKIEKQVEALADLMDARRDVLREQITKRVKLLLEDTNLDENRLGQEVVYYADRLDVTEEITRLGAHLKTTTALIKSDKRPMGKELEFLLQEQMREVTTIGNKAKHKEIADMVVALKTTYEKIREQVLNVE